MTRASYLFFLVVATACGDRDITAPDGGAAADAGTGVDSAVPRCTADRSSHDLGTLGTDPDFAAVVATGDHETLALWDDNGRLFLSRFPADGSPPPELIAVAPSVVLPGGDMRLRALSVEPIAGGYVAAWQERADTIHLRRLEADGSGVAPSAVNPTSRPGGAVDQAFGPLLRVDGERFTLRWAEYIGANPAVALQVFDSTAAPVIAQSVGFAAYNSTAATAILAGDEVHAARYEQGPGSVRDLRAIVARAPVGDLASWTNTELAIEQPAGDVWRHSPHLFALPSGRVFVDMAAQSAGVRRVEIVRLGEDDAIVRTELIELDASVQFSSEVRATAFEDTLYVVWADSADVATFDSTIHLARIGADGTRRDAEVALPRDAYLDDLGPILGAPRREDGGVSVAYLWKNTLDETWHAGSHFFCLNE
jgi:hypothetical protein